MGTPYEKDRRESNGKGKTGANDMECPSKSVSEEEKIRWKMGLRLALKKSEYESRKGKTRLENLKGTTI